MAGAPQTADKLNHTLHWVLDLFDKHDIDDWFISYGTLLGVIRDGSCIDGDDDIDICVNRIYWQNVNQLLNPEALDLKHKNFINLKPTSELGQIDFYFCDVNEDGDFHDTWERVVWTGCYGEDGYLDVAEFQGRELNVPANYIKKLETRYGSTWKQRIKRGTQAGDGYRNHFRL